MTDEYPYANAVVVISAVPSAALLERGPPGGSPDIGGGSSA
jgi:hypothetical protein